MTYQGMFNDFFLNVSPYLPVAFVVLGLVFAFFSIKGLVRMTLLLLNSLSLLLLILIVYAGIFGFREP